MSRQPAPSGVMAEDSQNRRDAFRMVCIAGSSLRPTDVSRRPAEQGFVMAAL
jgi:hypothetical protein